MRTRALRVIATGEWLAVKQETTGTEFGQSQRAFKREALEDYPDLTTDEVEVVEQAADPRTPPFREPQARPPAPPSQRVQAIRDARANVAAANSIPALQAVVDSLITSVEYLMGERE